MQIKDRIKELRRVKASELLPNPKNWRTHPKEQADALKGLFSEIGIAGAVLARELNDGSLMLVDGHLRAETLGIGEIPVLVLDVSEAEADKLLATLDPLGAMATTDSEKLDGLMRQIQTSNQSVANMLSNLAKDAGLYLEAKTDETNEVPVLSKGAINYVLIFDNEEQQNRWYQWLKKLKDNNPEIETHAERIDCFLKGLGEQ